MKRAILCAAALLLASGSLGQQRIGEPEHVCRWTLKGGGYEYNACPPEKQAKKAPVTTCDSYGPFVLCEQQEKKAPPVLGNATVVYDLSYHIARSLFDVPPKEWDGPDTENSCQNVPNCDGFMLPVHHRTCADPKRALLMSEDKVWHCYLFEEKP